MEGTALTPDDERLVDHAIATCESTFDPEFFDGAHIVAAALRTADGDVYDGVSLPASIGRASLCAEPGAVSVALADGADRADFETIVAVAYAMDHHDADEARVVPPCGVCAELLVDYNDALGVVVPVDEEGGALTKVSAGELLPARTW